jgi:Leucine-rich repeat (LRR) protein
MYSLTHKIPKSISQFGNFSCKYYPFTFQIITGRAFDGLNNLKRLKLDYNRLKSLEPGTFTPTPALTYLNLMRNTLESITMITIQPLMNNLVNHTSMMLIKGNFYYLFIYAFFIQHTHQ